MTTQELQNKCEEMVKILPIAHYLKVRTINVEFSLTEMTSYHDGRNNKIVVAFNNISKAINNAKNLNDAQLERVIRGLLYHEVSHAILTPLQLMNYAYNRHNIYPNCIDYLTDNEIANIIEDERIETILKHYYLNVDFVENKKLIITFDKRASVVFKGFIFNLVRFKYSPYKQKECLELFNEFMLKTKKMNSYTSVNSLYSYMNDFVVELQKIYNEFINLLKKANDKQKQNEEDESNGDSQDGEDSSNNQEEESNENDESSSEESEEENDSNDEESEEDESEDIKSSNGENEEEMTEEEEQALKSLKDMEENQNETSSLDENEEDFEDVFEEEELEKQIIDLMNQKICCEKRCMATTKDYIANKKCKAELIKIIGKNEGFGTKENTAQFGYSGRFNAKKFSTDFNDNCKWFKKNSMVDNGINAKKSNEKVINIWLDNSGSFSDHDASINSILKAIYEIEEKRDDFKVNFIKVCDYLFIPTNKEERVSYSSGGNSTNIQTWKNTYKQVNKTGKEKNLVLFDGCVSGRNGYEFLRIFDNKNTTFITEQSNTIGIMNVCPKATLIEENTNYEDKLAENVVKAFENLF